jgi:hypothetical protein
MPQAKMGAIQDGTVSTMHVSPVVTERPNVVVKDQYADIAKISRSLASTPMGSVTESRSIHRGTFDGHGCVLIVS